jgi:hypothetical protein
LDSADADVLERASARRLEDTLAGRPLDEDTRWAKDITQKIVNRVAELHLLVEEAHAGKAHLKLGYERWEDYVQEHFNFGRKQAHNYLLQGRVIRALGSAANGAKVDVAPGHAKRIHPVLDEVVEVLRRFIDAGHDPDWSVQAIIDWYGRPTKREALGLVRAVPESRDAMGLQLAETGALAELEPEEPNPKAHMQAVYDFMEAFKKSVPPVEWLTTLNHGQRKRLLSEIAKGEKWLAELRQRVDELPPGPPMPPPPTSDPPDTATPRRVPPAP